MTGHHCSEPSSHSTDGEYLWLCLVVVEYVLRTRSQKKGQSLTLKKAKSKQETGQREKECINWVTGLGHHAVCLSDASCNVYAATFCSMIKCCKGLRRPRPHANYDEASISRAGSSH
jgi:hypothetical protein